MSIPTALKSKHWECYRMEKYLQIHVAPANDLITHNANDECVCGPTAVDALHEEDGTIWWIMEHHSLDGREHGEDNLSQREANLRLLKLLVYRMALIGKAKVPPHKKLRGWSRLLVAAVRDRDSINRM